MPAKLLTKEKAFELLAEAPKRIAACTAGLTAAQLGAAPATGEWSVNEVLAHIRACADVRGGAIGQILAADHPTIRAVNPLTWLEKTDYRELAFEPSFRAFVAQRRDLLATLGSLPDDGWARSATVTGAGKPLERTVLYYADWVAVHERPHLKQIERAAEAVRR